MDFGLERGGRPDPQTIRAGSDGRRGWPPTPLQPEIEAFERMFAHSDKFVLPSITASAVRSLTTSGASRWVTLSSSAMLPAVVGSGPSASMLSLSRKNLSEWAN